jgi:hypothetical protein
LVDKDLHILSVISKSPSDEAKTLEKMRIGNPIGMGLPLIEALVKGASVEIVIPYVNQNQLSIKVNNV